MSRFFHSPPREKRRAEARRAHLLTRAHGDRVPGRHSTHEAIATMSQMVRVVAPARATATSSSLARKPRWRATRVGSPPERTKRVARLSSRTLHRLTHRASVLPARRSKHTEKIMQKRQADMEEAYAAQVRSPRFARCAASRSPRERRTPTVAFVPDPHPPAAVGRMLKAFHPDYDPQAKGNDVVKASRETEELLNAIVKVRLVVTRDILNIDRSPSRSRTAAKKPTVFYPFFSLRTRFSSGRPLLRDAHRPSPRPSSILSARADDPRSCAE